MTTQHCCKVSTAAARHKHRLLDPSGKYLILPSPHSRLPHGLSGSLLPEPLPSPGHQEQLAHSPRFRNWTPALYIGHHALLGGAHHTDHQQSLLKHNRVREDLILIQTRISTWTNPDSGKSTALNLAAHFHLGCQCRAPLHSRGTHVLTS